jgi:hypothetical protein
LRLQSRLLPFAPAILLMPVFLISVFLATAIAPANAADPGSGSAAANARADVRACADARMLARITKRFAWAERNTWQRGYQIAAIEHPRLRYTVFSGPSMIRHRHCRASALMTNGVRRTVFYTVSAGMGFASIGHGVDFCLAGLDPWRVHGAACRSLR